MKVALVSFPKSGNTLVRFLLANVFYGDNINYSNINKYSSTGEERPEPNKYLVEFYKRHNFVDNKMLENFDKIIYIYRNGSDVIKSYRNFISAQHPKLIDNDVDFIRFHGYYYGEWGDHILNSFRMVNDRVHLVQYEELISDAESVLTGILSFLNVKIDSAITDRALELCSRDNMKLLSGTKDFIQMKMESGYNFVGNSNRLGLSEEAIAMWLGYHQNSLALKMFYGNNNGGSNKIDRHNFIMTKFWRYWILLKNKLINVIEN